MSIKSMTGYGKGICEKDGLRVVVEIKTVNHRFLDLTIKLPKIFNFAEDAIRKEIKNTLEITKKTTQKKLNKQDATKEIERLKGLMNIATKQLDFETAITLRDEISKLKKQLGK